MPQIALEALETGLDCPATRRAARSLNVFEVAKVLPRVMQELGLAQITTGEAALRIAQSLAKEILQSDDPRKHLRDFESLWVRSKSAKGITKLGTLDDDVWRAESTGQSEPQIGKWVTARLKEFASHPNAP